MTKLNLVWQFNNNGKITKSGATWRFRHRILQEYFAEQWKELKIEDEGNAA